MCLITLILSLSFALLNNFHTKIKIIYWCYNVVRADHPSNTEKVVFSSISKALPINVLDIQLLHKCINFEIKIADKTWNFISLYRSPSQSKDEF